jgi:hypothetical protein
MFLETVGGLAGKKIAGDFIKQMGKGAIGYWTDYRAKGFVDGFVTAVGEGRTEAELAPLLTGIIKNKRQSELLFEGYRHVALSKSREVGPRAVGLLTAQIIHRATHSTNYEESWFLVFESLSDTELLLAADFLADVFAKSRVPENKEITLKGNDLIIEWAEDKSSRNEGMDVSPLDFYESIGSWAGKLNNLGILRTRLTDLVTSYSDSMQGTSLSGELMTTRKVTWWIDTNIEHEKLAKLIKQAKAMVPQEKWQDLR